MTEMGQESKMHSQTLRVSLTLSRHRLFREADGA